MLYACPLFMAGFSKGAYMQNETLTNAFLAYLSKLTPSVPGLLKTAHIKNPD